MDKLAQVVKVAEVRGVTNFLIDTGAIKVASDDEFDALVSSVSQEIGDNYTIDTIINKTAQVLGIEASED